MPDQRDFRPPASNQGGTLYAALVLLLSLLVGLGLGGARGTLSAQAGGLGWQASQTIGDGQVPGQHDPAFLLDTDGALNALWVDDRLGPGLALFTARRMASGQEWPSPERVYALDPDAADAGGAALASPALAEGPDGRLHALWILRRRLGSEVWHASRGPGGRTWSRPQRVDAGDLLDRSDPALVVVPAGTLHAVWTEGREDADIVHASTDAEGTWGPPQRLNTPGDGTQRHAALVATGDGNLYASWEDTRLGHSAIAASRLPPGGDVWWPNAILGPEGAAAVDQRAPVLAVDGAGLPTVLWVEERGLGQVHRATLPAPDAYWRDDGVVYRAVLGRLLDLAWATAPGEGGLLLWTEAREDPSGDRLLAAAWGPSGLGPSGRVDLGRDLGHAASPRALVDGIGQVHALWLGRGATDRSGRLRTARAELPLSRPDQRKLQGRLVYAGRPFGCPTEAFALLACDGAWLAYLRPDGFDLVPFLGSWIQVDGTPEILPRCELLRVEGAKFAASPCPEGLAVLTGRLSLMQRPLEGALAQVAGAAARSGPSGRYVLAPPRRGLLDLAITAPCALSANLKGLGIIDGFNSLPDLALWPGDLDQDCAVSIGDLVILARQLGAPADLAQPACADLDGDGSVGIQDLAPIAANLGAACAGGAPLAAAPSDGAVPAAAGADLGLSRMDAAPVIRLGSQTAPARVWQVRVRPAGPGPERVVAAGRAPFAVAVPGLLVLRNAVDAQGAAELLAVRPGQVAPPAPGAVLAKLLIRPQAALSITVQAVDDMGRLRRPDAWLEPIDGQDPIALRELLLPFVAPSVSAR